MARILILLAVLATAAADPLVFTSPYLASSFVRPYLAPYTSPYNSPYTSAALVAPGGPAVPAGVPAVSQAVPAAVPLSSVSAYSYGSSYSIQDYAPLVNTAAGPLYSSAYSVPYSYADWIYRR